jgi:hypothetical protein
MKPAIVKQLATQEAEREHCTFLQGIGLKVTGIVAGTGGQPYQPRSRRGQRANAQEDFPTLGIAAARRLQAQAPPLPFAVTEGFLDVAVATHKTIDLVVRTQVKKLQRNMQK